MANWNKLNAKFKAVMQSMTKEKWDAWKLRYELRKKGWQR